MILQPSQDVIDTLMHWFVSALSVMLFLLGFNRLAQASLLSPVDTWLSVCSYNIQGMLVALP